MKIIIKSIMEYEFIQNALLVGILIAICCSLLGIFLVLRKHSLIGDGLAHVSFATTAIAVALGVTPLVVSIPLVILASFIINALNSKANVYGDAAIGLVSSVSLAIGNIISSVTKGFSVDINSYLFGSILSISRAEVIISVILSILVILSVLFFYKGFFSITFDEEFAKVKGLNVNMLNSVLSVLTSITIVLGIRVVGTLLISSMIIFPTVSALQLETSFKRTMIYSALISVICVVLGIVLSFAFDLPTGASIVILNAIFFVVLFTLKKIKNR